MLHTDYCSVKLSFFKTSSILTYLWILFLFFYQNPIIPTEPSLCKNNCWILRDKTCKGIERSVHKHTITGDFCEAVNSFQGPHKFICMFSIGMLVPKHHNHNKIIDPPHSQTVFVFFFSFKTQALKNTSRFLKVHIMPLAFIKYLY